MYKSTQRIIEACILGILTIGYGLLLVFAVRNVFDCIIDIIGLTFFGYCFYLVMRDILYGY